MPSRSSFLLMIAESGSATRFGIVGGIHPATLLVPCRGDRIERLPDWALIYFLDMFAKARAWANAHPRLGRRDGDWVEVVEGLAPGQRVVSRGAYLVKLAATNTGQIGHGHAH